jgi:hypothetical protein
MNGYYTCAQKAKKEISQIFFFIFPGINVQYGHQL